MMMLITALAIFFVIAKIADRFNQNDEEPVREEAIADVEGESYEDFWDSRLPRIGFGDANAPMVPGRPYDYDLNLYGWPD